MSSLWVDGLGWVGATLLLIAYALVSLRGYRGTSAPFQLLNLAGSALLIVNSAYYGAYPSAFLSGLASRLPPSRERAAVSPANARARGSGR